MRIKNLLAFYCLALTFFSPIALGDSDPVELPLPENACWFSGNFSQEKELKGLAEPVKSNGHFFYHCEFGVIWQVTSPVAETLVFQQTGNAYAIKQDAISKIDSRQSKLLGKMLNSLIGGDQQAISKQFKVSQPAPASEHSVEYLLEPKKRKLRRALKQIKLTLPNETGDEDSPITIAMQDRKQQWTTINASQNPSPDAETDAESHCGETIISSACDLLLQSETTDNNQAEESSEASALEEN